MANESDRVIAREILEMFLRATMVDAAGGGKGCEKGIIALINKQAKEPQSIFTPIKELHELPGIFNLDNENAHKVYEELLKLAYPEKAEALPIMQAGIEPFITEESTVADPFLHLVAHFGHALEVFDAEEFSFIKGQLESTTFDDPRRSCKLVGAFLLAIHKIPQSTLKEDYANVCEKALEMNKIKKEARAKKAEEFIDEMINKYLSC